MKNLVPVEIIEKRIYLIRGQKVMLDKDLAELYGVETFNLNKAVKRNVKRFPKDFMFQLNKTAFENLIFQFGISRWGGTRKLPYVFTENGIAMLSSVLRSDRAIQVNIQIMRIFTKLRALMENNKALSGKLKELESKVGTNTDDIKLIFETIKQMLAVPEKPKRKIGSHYPMHH